MRSVVLGVVAWSVAFLLMALGALSVTQGQRGKAKGLLPMNADEFVGPFTSWLDVRRDCGARGDGIADDTEALQKAFNLVRPPTAKVAVVYLPSGTYRLTKTLRLERQSHGESMHLIVVGEHPETTVLRWDGEAGGVMIAADAWYSAFRRLTLDGAGKARTAVLCGPHFVTYNEFADMVFCDVAFGIEAGTMKEAGVAETAVVRCRFLRCSQAGISVQNFNSLDWWIWHSVFDDCGYGVTNTFGAGNFHIYHSRFRRSRIADIGMGHCGFFSVRDNFSQNSRAFVVTAKMNCCHFLTLQGNTVLDAQETPVRVGSLGPVFLLDNTFCVRSTPSVIVHPEGGLVSVGNTFTTPNPIQAGENAWQGDDRIVKPSTLRVAEMQEPKTPPIEKRLVFDLPTDATATDIQRAINEAAKHRGKRPVVHLPVGDFAVDRTLVIPKGSDVRLVGDGGKTVLRWAGKGDGPVLRIIGPSHAVVKDLMVDGGQGDGIVVEGCDQPDGCFIADQLYLGYDGGQTGLSVERLRRFSVQLFNFQFAFCRLGVQVVGSGDPKRTAPVVIFSGASADNDLTYEVTDGGYLVVRDIWYESAKKPRFAVFNKGSGTFVLHGSRCYAAHPQPGDRDIPVVEVVDFQGDIAFLMSDLNRSGSGRPKVLVRKGNERLRLLLLGFGADGDDDALVTEAENPHWVAAQVYKILPDGSWQRAKGRGNLTRELLLALLSPTRQAHPKALLPVNSLVTDLRFHRVLVRRGRMGLRLLP